MQNSSHTNRPKTKKFDVFMLSDSDVAFLNNEAPKAFDEALPFESGTDSGNNNQSQQFTSSSPQQFQENPLLQRQMQQSNPVSCGIHYPSEPQHNYPSENISSNREKEYHSAPFASHEPESMIFSSVSETKILRKPLKHNSDNIDDIVQHIVANEPLLTNEDLLYLIKKEYPVYQSLSRRALKQVLIRNSLQTEYKRFQAYIAG
jgi:hypothetical protein